MKTKTIDYAGKRYVSVVNYDISDIPKDLRPTFYGELVNSKMDKCKVTSDDHVYLLDSLNKFKKSFLDRWVIDGMFTIGGFYKSQKLSVSNISRFSAFVLNSNFERVIKRKLNKHGHQTKSRPYIFYKESDLVNLRKSINDDIRSKKVICLIEFIDLYPSLKNITMFKRYLNFQSDKDSRILFFEESYLIEQYKLMVSEDVDLMD